MTTLPLCKDIASVDNSSYHSRTRYHQNLQTSPYFLQFKASMATTPNLNSKFEVIPKLHRFEKIAKRATITCFDHHNKNVEAKATRRLVLGLASIAFFGTHSIGISMAEDNGYWLTGPIPVPIAKNRINNEETGTRSFLKKGIYIADIGTKGRMRRLRRYAFDLIAMADLIAQRDAWNYVRRYLHLKSTFMYYDFDNLVSASAVDDQKGLLDLANRLFDSFEKLDDAVRKQDVPQIFSCYEATTPVLEEVMTRMA